MTEPAVAANLPAGAAPGVDELDVSIVLPVYNEKGHLNEEIDRIRAAMDASEFSYEIIVIDDGSNDGSGDALRAIEGIRLIQFLTNRGSGSARKYGTRAARGRVVVWTDVDMSYPNDLIPELVRELEGYDQVVGARTSEEGTHKLFRVPAKAFIRKLASYLVQTPIPDLNSGLRAFRRETVRAERVHWLILASTPVHLVWCRPTIFVGMVAYGLALNVPFIIVQRANRGRLDRILSRRRRR